MLGQRLLTQVDRIQLNSILNHYPYLFAKTQFFNCLMMVLAAIIVTNSTISLLVKQFEIKSHHSIVSALVSI